jgi:hypothetical protein
MERGSNGSASRRTQIKTVYDTRNPRKSALLASALSAFKSFTKRHWIMNYSLLSDYKNAVYAQSKHAFCLLHKSKFS